MLGVKWKIRNTVNRTVQFYLFIKYDEPREYILLELDFIIDSLLMFFSLREQVTLSSPLLVEKVNARPWFNNC